MFIFVCVIGTVSQSFSNLDSLELDDALELLETTQDTLDDLWKQDEHKPYPETRMKHLLDIMAGENFFMLPVADNNQGAFVCWRFGIRKTEIT